MSEARIAIVTGAARGIGAGVAVRLAADGFRVAAIDLHREACDEVVGRIEADGGTALAVGADISDPEQVQAAFARILGKLGAPSVLVNNAGITRDNLIFKMTVDEWDAVLGVHLRGSFLMAKAAQTYMVENRYGRIINLSSTSALGHRGQANYSAAKAGVQGFTKTLAIELGRFGITVNAIAPGFVVTEMTRATAERRGISFEEYQAESAAAIAVQRVGAPADIANAVSFFAGEAAGFVSGQILYVAGGPKT